MGQIMKCGCRSQGTDKEGNPICIVHNIQEKSETLNLKGRKAVCHDCKSERDSCDELPFFQYRPTCKNDSYYCGCKGWD